MLYKIDGHFPPQASPQNPTSLPPCIEANWKQAFAPRVAHFQSESLEGQLDCSFRSIRTMWNIHAFNHRVTALSMAFLASAGLICFALSGLSCEYLELQARPDRFLMSPAGIEFEGETLAFLGVQCYPEPLPQFGTNSTISSPPSPIPRAAR